MSVPTDQMIPAPAQLPVIGAASMPPEAGIPEVMPLQVSEERVKNLVAELDAAREVDGYARKDYAFCRLYARGASHWEVSLNLLGTYIDIMVSFLSARNPDVACVPSASVGNRRKAEAKIFAD